MAASKELQKKAGLSSLPLPLYYQIASSLRERIMRGEWAAGAKLPTEKELSGQYKVSRQTVRKAKDDLIRDGLIVARQGAGCFINPPERWNTRPPTVENLKEFFTFALTTSFKIQTFGMVANSPEISRRLRNQEDEFVFQIRGVRYQKGDPLSYVVYHLPPKFAARIPLDELDEKAFIPQFEKLAGIRTMEGIQSISLGRADHHSAEHLGLESGDPVLVVETIYTDEQDRPIEFVRSQYREKLPYSIRVKRD